MPRRADPLNAKQVERIKPGEELVDGDVPGLRGRLTADGIAWSLNVNVGGVRRRMAVGRGIGLAEARKRAKAMRQDIADGMDPTTEREAQRHRQKEAAQGRGTLRGALDAYFAHRPELRSVVVQRKALTAVFKPWLGHPALNVTPALAQLAVDKWARERSATLASRAVTYFKPFARWAWKRGLLQKGFNELERPAQKQKKQLVLSQGDVGTLLRSLGGSSRDIAIRVMLMTGARCGEACDAVWGEFDLDQGVWVLPGRRRKNPKPGRVMPDHFMPLPTRCVGLLRTIGPRGPDDLVFVGARGAVLANWPKWTRQMKAKLGIDVTPHALRRTFATLLGELGAPPHVVEAALGHAVIKNELVVDPQLAATYNKAVYAIEVRENVDRLADRLDVLEAGGNVVALPRRA